MLTPHNLFTLVTIKTSPHILGVPNLKHIKKDTLTLKSPLDEYLVFVWKIIQSHGFCQESEIYDKE